ncbi:LLM class flavin-dependent oxidoreductase [Paenibacillus hemerocallicola]|jgi:FMN-dependent oxidoreductase (nitrilotriacetate monooxygenase family)|uniref:LLM class flavin-dependent oxidoreductase n=1 Tax=Paenibacillus hemerocallicola TaxID=1172614 RepID=A0A5C4SZS4_9BACL|nr:LLM class flavin-dependent oxidoreductase [Paenibacillus hemerocallicola]TNJ62358.1 LLM class flavin-dependent oxidoreductase [Paenibacillus hemerocallicola]
MGNGINKKKQLKLATFLSGFGSNIAGWRHPGTPSDAAVNLDLYIEVAKIAEAGKFDFLFNADSAYITKDSTPYFLSRFEPATVLSAIAAVTKNLGLVGTFSTSYSEPFTTARQLASLDKLSGGRAGWNAVTSALEGVARNFSHDTLMEHGLRYRVASEYIEIVKGLWDSWEDDAFVRDKESGQYVDLDKMHTLDHKGEFFSVQGPLNIERSPQGRPIVFQAGGSEEGRDLAAREADGIYSRYTDYEPARAFSEDIKRRAVAYGRSPGDILIFPAITPIVGETKEEADYKYEQTSKYVDIDLAIQYMSRFFSFFNFKQFPLDEPLPELGDIGKNSFKSTAELYLKMAKDENLTLRQLALRVISPKGNYIGTPVQVADNIQSLFETGVVDGFVLSPHVNPEGLRDFVEQVVPILQDRGVFRADYESSTLRGNLGLTYPENRYTKARREQSASATLQA